MSESMNDCIQRGQESWRAMRRLHSMSSSRRGSPWQHSLLSWQQPGQGLQLAAPGILLLAALLLRMPDIALMHTWLRSDTLHEERKNKTTPLGILYREA